MLHGRSEDELGVCGSQKFQRDIRLLEHDELAGGNGIGKLEPPRKWKHPRNLVPGGWLIEPSLAVLQAHMQIVDGIWRPNRAAHIAVTAQRDSRRALLLHFLRST